MNNDTNDNELLYLIDENNEEAMTEIIERYTPKIHKVISKYKDKGLQVGLDISDLYQEGLIGLMEAIKTFDREKDASFKTFATILIEREIIDMIRSYNRIKYKTLNNAISLDNFSYSETANLYNLIEDNNTPEIALIEDEEIKETKKILTDYELKVYELKIDGKTNAEISKILNKDQKSIDNTLNRIRMKIKTKNKLF